MDTEIIEKNIIYIIVGHFDVPYDFCVKNLCTSFTGEIFNFDFIDLIYLFYAVEKYFNITFKLDNEKCSFNSIKDIAQNVCYEIL